MYKDEEFCTKEYFKTLNIFDARTIFKMRAKMTQYVKWNYQNDVKNRAQLWQCSSCQSSIDTQSHITWCPAYSDLRENRSLENDKDLAGSIKN